MKKQSEPSFYAILPATVRYDKNLSSSEKVFYCEVTAMAKKEGYCWASNSYFAELYGVSTSTVSSWVSSLKEKGHINVDYERNGKEVKRRLIYPIQNIDHPYSENNKGGSQKIDRGYSENRKENSTSNNTTRENKESLPEKIQNCETIQALSKIWFSYRQEKSKWPTLSEQEMLTHQLKRWGLPKSKKIVSEAMKNGWVSLKEEYISEDTGLGDNSKFRKING